MPAKTNASAAAGSPNGPYLPSVMKVHVTKSKELKRCDDRTWFYHTSDLLFDSGTTPAFQRRSGVLTQCNDERVASKKRTTPYLRGFKDRHAPEWRLGQKLGRLAVARVAELWHLDVHPIILCGDQYFERAEVGRVRPKLLFHIIIMRKLTGTRTGSNDLTM